MPYWLSPLKEGPFHLCDAYIQLLLLPFLYRFRLRLQSLPQEFTVLLWI